jgi:hypothetical protein
MPSNQQSKSASFKDALHQSPSTPIDITDKAKVVYRHLRTLGLPDSVTFDCFLSVYSLGLGETPTDRKGDIIQENLGVCDGENKKHNALADMKERQMTRTRPMESKSRLRMSKKMNDGGDSKKGSWKEMLDIVAQRLVGRSEAVRVRAFISAAKSNSETPFEDPMKIADGRRESLYRMLGSVQKEWEIESRQLMDLDRRKKELENEVDRKRKAILLMNILEKREGFRMKRLGGIGNRDSEGNAGIGELMKRLR